VAPLPSPFSLFQAGVVEFAAAGQDLLEHPWLCRCVGCSLYLSVSQRACCGMRLHSVWQGGIRRSPVRCGSCGPPDLHPVPAGRGTQAVTSVAGRAVRPPDSPGISQVPRPCAAA
jgi:hypothetical protein